MSNSDDSFSKRVKRLKSKLKDVDEKDRNRKKKPFLVSYKTEPGETDSN